MRWNKRYEFIFRWIKEMFQSTDKHNDYVFLFWYYKTIFCCRLSFYLQLSVLQLIATRCLKHIQQIKFLGRSTVSYHVKQKPGMTIELDVDLELVVGVIQEHDVISVRFLGLLKNSKRKIYWQAKLDSNHKPYISHQNVFKKANVLPNCYFLQLDLSILE